MLYAMQEIFPLQDTSCSFIPTSRRLSVSIDTDTYPSVASQPLIREPHGNVLDCIAALGWIGCVSDGFCLVW